MPHKSLDLLAGSADHVNFTFAYDKRGLLTERRGWLQGGVGDIDRFEYDGLNRVKNVFRGGGTDPKVSYTYDGSRLDAREARTTADAPVPTIEYDLVYDDFLRPKEYINNVKVDTIATELVKIDLTHDNVGNALTMVIDSCASPLTEDVTYDYDGLHRLKSATYDSMGGSQEVFTMDLLGNRDQYADARRGLTIDYTQNNSANEYDQIGPVSNQVAVTYDQRGNLVQHETGANLTYDADNRLVGVTTAAGSAVYTYDSLGRRVTETKDGQTTHFFYDGQRVFAEYDETETLKRYFIDGATYVDEHVVMVEGGTEYYYLTGPLFSVLGLADADGNILESYRYDPYGAVHKDTAFVPAALGTQEHGNRYLAIVPPAGTEAVALRVRAMCDGAVARYVGEVVGDDPDRNRAPLVDDISEAAFKTPADWLGAFPAVYVFGPEIVPGTTYEVQIDNGTATCPMLSWPTVATSALFGDVTGVTVNGVRPPPDGTVDILDLTGAIDAFHNLPMALFHFADMNPVNCTTQAVLVGADKADIIDLVIILDAFRALTYDEVDSAHNDCGASPCPIPPPSGPSGNPYFFTGRRLDFDLHDAATGNPTLTLYHYRARAYDALNGRFTQREPLGYVDGMSLYQYVKSSPARFVDPTGAQAQDTAPPILTDPGPGIFDLIDDVRNVDFFFSHFLLRSGEPVLLLAAEADEVMNTFGVRLEIDNQLTSALDRAEELPCKPPKTSRGEYRNNVRAEAVANYPWHLIIGRFRFFGKTKCSIRKTCACCKDGSNAYRVHASCTIRLSGKDPFDFHSFPANAIPGVPYNILWTWQTVVGRSAHKKCKDGSIPPFPSVGGGGGSF